jgi:hypothetical protein
MTTVLIVYLVLGLVLGWLACRRQYDKHLKTANEQRKQLAEALGKATAQQVLLSANVTALGLENKELKGTVKVLVDCIDENNQLKSRLERAVVPVGDGDTFPA